ncbi:MULTISPECIES: hypothetical protein [unclassified Gemella]|uniref:hypothetical protein n=1 Tax=unclassified Gemella TaxID=2624949 RepID=UPI0010735468|nr:MULTISPECIES: hypothetical protein [unclassified Gemella]MBF0709759.1 hypothetical protein [Gemella sp. GL1.1]MBF0747277.1 hypothetical protein [Gemella sp. 19428wG2_WT2a]NYS27103.1 hypothetical protein [Gemella sp. GL1]TFU57862.1 hypothetical protein E4T67_06355 [Gemella sp. WT2a]
MNLKPEIMTTKELIEELLKRGAVRIKHKLYNKKQVILEEKYTQNKRKSVLKDVLILDNINEN